MQFNPLFLRATWAALAVTVVGCEGSPTGVDGEEFAAHGTLPIGSSNFEIEEFGGTDDAGANLKNDDGNPAIDWVDVMEFRQQDEPSGQNDDSLGGGSKEDSYPPKVTDGSIPPNKSDLRFFGVNEETVNNDSYLNMYWTRVDDPSGTTLMDFEFNQEQSDPASLIRTGGDLLVVYKLSSGGDGDNGIIDLVLHQWQTGVAPWNQACEAAKSFPCWGEEQDLSGSGLAVGSINNEAIPGADADGLADGLTPFELSPRTFGEATIDLSAIFPADSCFTLGQAWLKSRSSDTFTTALKDFIAPVPINISNCGKVIIRKQTDPDGATDEFDFTSTVQVGTGGEDTADSGGDSGDTGASTDTPAAFDLADDESYTIVNVLLGDDYEVLELDPSSLGYELTDIDCTASTGVVPDSESLVTRKVIFDIDSPDDILDCTFTNTGKASLKVIKTTVPSGLQQKDFSFGITGPSAFSDTFMLSNLSDGTEEQDYDGTLDPGSYDITETIPTGWRLNSWSCIDKNDGDNVVASSTGVNDNDATVALAAGDDIECTFENEPLAKVGGLFQSLATANGGDYGYLQVTLDCSGQAPDTATPAPTVLSTQLVRHVADALAHTPPFQSGLSDPIPAGAYDCQLVIAPNTLPIPSLP